MVQNNGQNYLPKFTGQVYPLQPKRKSHPVYDNHCFCGVIDNKFSRLRIWVQPPNLQYPETSVFLGLNTGRDSAFTKITLDELVNIHNMLAGCISDINSILPTLKAQEVVVQGQQDQAHSALNQQRLISTLSNILQHSNPGQLTDNDYHPEDELVEE